MADFEAMSQFRSWRDCSVFRRIRDVYQPDVFINADQGSFVKEQQYTRNAAIDVWKAGDTSELVAGSVVWPYYAYKEKLGSPFVLGGMTAVVAAPLYDPTIGIGAALLVGYVIGAATFYAQNRGVRRQPQDRSDETKGVSIRPSLQ